LHDNKIIVQKINFILFDPVIQSKYRSGTMLKIKVMCSGWPNCQNRANFFIKWYPIKS